jgi:TatD DNase family protein
MKALTMNLWDIHTHQSGHAFSILDGMDRGLIDSGRYSLGIHPWQVNVHWEEKLREIQQHSSTNPQVLAIGEAGFDRLKGPGIPLQKAAFHAQANWAKILGIPLILHCVKANDLFLEYLKSEKNPPAIIWHGWNLKPELARQLLPFPVFFSFGRQALQAESNSQKWLGECPRERIFFETDDSGVEISSIYQAASLFLGLSMEQLSVLVIANWNHISKRKIE